MKNNATQINITDLLMRPGQNKECTDNTINGDPSVNSSNNFEFNENGVVFDTEINLYN